ncbi:hypothetical protein [uncultured Agitococcus sp.]|uniref:hypothetical protein n=1 Tax=uncultured Agitococcus sp. TaxID=1506599 RepID=UPI00260D0572|nr:hypothetical protein [uncultured Agitococcus sp.]
MNTQTLPWLKFSHESYIFNFRVGTKAAVKAAYLDLLCLCMKQSPALSIPNDDKFLANWCNLTLKAWLKIKDQVLSQFALNSDNNRYYSIMLVENYQETDQLSTNQELPTRAKTNAERQAEYRARQQEAQRNASNERNNSVTPHNEPRNESNVTNLDKDLNKNININPVVLVQPTVETPTTATTGLVCIDFFKPTLSSLSNVTKHNDKTLHKFISYNQGKSLPQTDLDKLYDYWLSIEKSAKTTTEQPKPIGDTLYGVLKSDIERLARAGESYEQAAIRIKQQRAEKERDDKYKAA